MCQIFNFIRFLSLNTLGNVVIFLLASYKNSNFQEVFTSFGFATSTQVYQLNFSIKISNYDNLPKK